MRQQLYQQQTPQPGGGGYVASAPGTVVMQQQTSGPFGTTTRTTTYGPGTTTNSVSGFNTFGGPPMQYRSYSSVETAPGTTVTQQYSIPTPLYYTGNPSVYQALNDLEIRVTGTSNPNIPFNVRLTDLETRLTGKTFPNYTDAERVNNLMRIYQYQALSKTLNTNPPTATTAPPPVQQNP